MVVIPDEGGRLHHIPFASIDAHWRAIEIHQTFDVGSGRGSPSPHQIGLQPPRGTTMVEEITKLLKKEFAKP
jgi:hypothetical protein